MDGQEVRIVRGAALATALAAPVAVVIAWLATGPAGALGALLGVALATTFFAMTVIVVGIAARISPDLMLPAALGTYVAKIIGLGVLLVAFRHATAFNRSAFALATVAGACVFMVAEVRIAARSRVPYVIVPEAPEGEESRDHGP